MQEVTAGVASAAIVEEKTEISTEEQWDDEAPAATHTKSKAAAAATVSGGELLDMKSLDTKRSDQGSIAEKLRVEETKAQLAAAKAGMEREAEKLKEAREKKDEKKVAARPTTGGSRFGAAAASMSAGGTGGKWLPPHLRGGAGGSIRSRMSGGGSGFQKVDTQNEQLFPDLAAADKILEKEKQDHQPMFKAPKKTPVGGGATWASKPKVPKVAPQAPKADDASGEQKASAPAVVSGAPVPKAVKKTSKKKKKDLSTYKPGSS